MTLSALCRFASLLLGLIVFSSPLGSAQARTKKILLLVDQMSAPAMELVAREFEADLTAKSPDQIELFRESLDTFLIPEEDYQEDVREWYEKKYSQRKLDLIVTVGPASHDFIVTVHSGYFPGVPVVFVVDIKRGHEAAAPDPHFTGVWMDLDPVSTVDVVRQLLPATKHIAVVSGSGLIDRLFTKAVKTKLQGYQGVDFTYLTDLDLSSLLEKVRNLSNDTVILYLTVTKDRNQQHLFVTYTLPLVSAAADVPVFGLVDLMVLQGMGIVGGRLSGYSDTGPLAAEIALRVLRGTTPESIPAITVANRYAFDWKQMQRWGLDASRLPAGSAVLNREPSAWQRYKRVILFVLALLVLSTSVMVYLLIERAKRVRVQQALEADVAERKKAEAALMDLSARLINAHEEERSRIARELHDDFNQRLAVLAINLKKAVRVFSSEPDKAVGRIIELCDQTSEIGEDLHKMSRNLHSSALDVLGLAEGINDLCDEFAEQHGLHVEFVAEDVPRTLSPAVALCLFRIAQEALNNVKKHSGASEVFVQLHRNSKEIVLSIADAGVGFDPLDPAFGAGLGLRSMKERLRAVGGTIEIDSSYGGGVQILARVPLS
jgi:signal transduction histidine kinase